LVSSVGAHDTKKIMMKKLMKEHGPQQQRGDGAFSLG
jgi:hypothetical protein